MSVNSRRFVDVNIRKATKRSLTAIRDTAVLFAKTAIDSTNVSLGKKYVDGNISGNPTGDEITDLTFTGMSVSTKNGKTTCVLSSNNGYSFTTTDVTYTGTYFIEIVLASATASEVSNAAMLMLYEYARMFFDNAGVKLRVITEDFTYANINALPNEDILVAKLGAIVSSDVSVITTYNAALDPETNGDGSTNAYGPSKKLFFTAVAPDAGRKTVTVTGLSGVDNLAVKCGLPGVEMTMCAYLTKINPYGSNTVKDYAFTIESIDGLGVADVDDATDNVYVSDELVGDCQSKDVNIDIVLSNQIRNVWGNTITADSLVNAYVLIVLQQTVEESLINVLSSKLTGTSGTAAIYSAIVDELDKYVNSGFLAAGNWDGTAWTETYNSVDYSIASANERLAKGYKIVVIPFIAMTQADAAAHKAPPVYIGLTNAYGIRKITIEGKVM